MLDQHSLRAALRALAVKDVDGWAAVLAPAMTDAAISSPRRAACFLGQCAHESMRFDRLAEDTTYRSPAKLLDLFPSRVHSFAQAQALVAAGAEAIANCVYAGRQGNGDEASGDGWRFRGAGLLQLTGRIEIGPFAADCKRTLEEAADWLRTKEGAVAGAVWYWTKHGLNAVADRLDHPAITLAINGAKMVGHAERVALSEGALAAIFDAGDAYVPGGWPATSAAAPPSAPPAPIAPLAGMSPPAAPPAPPSVAPDGRGNG